MRSSGHHLCLSIDCQICHLHVLLTASSYLLAPWHALLTASQYTRKRMAICVIIPAALRSDGETRVGGWGDWGGE